MRTYLYCDQAVESNIAIPELTQTNLKKTTISFNLEVTQPKSEIKFWLHDWLSPSGEQILSYGKQCPYHWLRFPALAHFRISANAAEITCYPLPDISLATIRHLLLEQVLPRCQAYHGRVMLHASAVQYQNGLLLFVGDSGAGKSTLAGNFHQAGQTVVSDDCVWLEEGEDQVVAVPTYAGLRLCEDSLQFLFSSDAETTDMAHYSSKKRVSLEENAVPGSEDGMPVLALIVLTPAGEGSEVKLEKLPHRDAFIAMLKQSFQLNPTDLDRMTRHAQALGRIVPRLRAFRLTMPHNYDLLPLVRQKILEAVA